MPLKNEATPLFEQSEKPDAEIIQLLSISTQKLAATISTASHAKLKGLYKLLVERIEVGKDRINLFMNPTALMEGWGESLQVHEPIRITKPINVKRRGQELRLVIGGQKSIAPKPDHSLIKLIAKAHLLKIELETGEVNSIKEFASKHGMDHGDAKNLVPLGFLAPNIIEDILAGQQPPELTTRQLKSAHNLPIMWNEQRRYLGFAA